MAKISTMTPDEMKQKVTPEILEESCQQFQQELIQMPILTMRESGTADYITIVPGVRNQLTWGELDGDAQLAPWSENNEDDDNSKIVGRTLVVYPGNCAKNFNPMPYFHSIYGQSIALGQAMTANTIARKVASMLSAKIGKHLDEDAIWFGKRNVKGKTTADLFDGFDTILNAGIESGELSVANGNFMDVPVINETNAVDVLKSIWRKRNKALKEGFMYIPPEIYDFYVDDYQTRHGNVPYNTSYDKDTLEGSRGKCKFAVVDSMAGSNLIKITKKENFLLGTDINSQENQVNIAKYKSWKLTFEYAGVYGAQVRTFSKEALMVARVAKAAADAGAGK
jgi:hypothetical protein